MNMKKKGRNGSRKQLQNHKLPRKKKKKKKVALQSFEHLGSE